MTIPYTFADQTGPIPLTELDANFDAPITLGTTPVKIGYTTLTLNGLTLTNPTIGAPSSGGVAYGLGGTLQYTAAGTPTYVLTAQGPGLAPIWAPSSSVTGGTVTNVAVTSANGFNGTVANPTGAADITMTVTVSGLIKGVAGALTSATSGVDYSAGTSALATGIVKSTTTTGALSIAAANTDYLPATAPAALAVSSASDALNINQTGAGNSLVIQGKLTVDPSGNITPGVTNTQALGAVGNVWGNVYATNFTGALTGNASTATILQTTRNINGVPFNGSADITISAAAAASSLTGTTLATNVVTSSLTTVGTLGSLAVTGAVTGSSFNSITGLSSTTPLVASTAAVGTGTTTARGDHVHPAQTTVTGNAGTATTLETARTINGTSFNGSANITVTAAAGTLTGTTLNATVVNSSLTSVGTLGVVTGTSFNSITGLSSTVPLVAGTGAAGNATTAARGNHVHPLQTTLNSKSHQSGSGAGGTAVTFSPAFTDLASIGLAVTTLDGYVAGISAISTTSFTVVTRTNAGAVSSQAFRWVAVGS